MLQMRRHSRCRCPRASAAPCLRCPLPPLPPCLRCPRASAAPVPPLPPASSRRLLALRCRLRGDVTPLARPAHSETARGRPAHHLHNFAPVRTGIHWTANDPR
eukprot:1674607-Prymnesium_polylepis.1